MIREDEVLQWLDEVKDPEIPVISLVDLGVIKKIELGENKVRVTITPTFVGCPAMEIMKQEIRNVLNQHGLTEVEIETSYQAPWSSDHISEKGKAALKKFGLAPPPRMALIQDLEILDHATCPRCNGTNTVMNTPFGPALCRSIHFCLDCKEGFEQFKPI